MICKRQRQTRIFKLMIQKKNLNSYFLKYEKKLKHLLLLLEFKN